MSFLRYGESSLACSDRDRATRDNQATGSRERETDRETERETERETAETAEKQTERDRERERLRPPNEALL